MAADAAAERSPNAYGHALNNLQRTHWHDVREGKAIFLTTWVAADRVAAERAARGPGAQVRAGSATEHNAGSCNNCHFRDGRGDRLGNAPPFLVRISVAGQPDPRYGKQLQDHARPPAIPEATLTLGYAPVVQSDRDGAFAVLRAPVLAIGALRDGPLGSETQTSVRIPASLIGLGLLEAVPVSTIAEAADPHDADGDGVSGRAAYVTDRRTGARALGRFGWKASQPTLWQQNATALREDLGVTTSADVAAHAAPALDDRGLEQLTRYTRLLEPPARRDRSDAEVQRGEAVFAQLGCATCHRPRLVTGDVADLPELGHRTIEPYSDLLLHDLGDALADHRPEGDADGREWRTAPLWGLGVLDVVSGEIRLLHDGRARSPEEAILWHGGEAQRARDRFTQLARRERAALLRFLGSL